MSLKIPENLAELPNELLEKIFGYVTHAGTRRRLSEVCKRFLFIIRPLTMSEFVGRVENASQNDIFTEVYGKSEFFPFSTLHVHIPNDKFPLEDLICKKIGNYITELVVEMFNSSAHSVVHNLSTYFPNVQKLIVCYRTPYDITRIMATAKQKKISLQELIIIIAPLQPLSEAKFFVNSCKKRLKFLRVKSSDIFVPRGWPLLAAKVDEAELVLNGRMDKLSQDDIAFLNDSTNIFFKTLEVDPEKQLLHFQSFFSKPREIGKLKFTDRNIAHIRKTFLEEYLPNSPGNIDLNDQKIAAIVGGGSSVEELEFPSVIFAEKNAVELLGSMPGCKWITFEDKEILENQNQLSVEVAAKVRSIKWYHKWSNDSSNSSSNDSSNDDDSSYEDIYQESEQLALDTLCPMVNLQDLTIRTQEGRFTDCIHDDGFQLIIQHLKQLKRLVIYASQLTDAGIIGEGKDWVPISTLQCLEHLHLGQTKNNAVTNRSFKEAIRFSNLKSFVFMGNIDNNGVEMLVDNNKCIESLQIHYCNRVDVQSFDYIVQNLPFIRELEFVLCGIDKNVGQEYKKKNPLSRLELNIYN